MFDVCLRKLVVALLEGKECSIASDTHQTILIASIARLLLRLKAFSAIER